MKPLHTSPLAAAVDRMGLLRAEIARLQAEAETIRAELEAAGLPHIDGHLYRATITQCKGAARTDRRAIAERFKPSAQLVRAHTTTGAESVRLTITARA